MEFLPAGEIIGEAHQIRTVTLNNSPQLPDGEYTFIDGYCTNPGCDCRKTIIRIIHNDHHVATVDYGWESPKFYAKWGRIDDELSREMSGLSIDFMSPGLIDREATLSFMEELLDEQWISRIKSTYQAVRTAVKKETANNNIIRLEPKISRNAPCPCGSGKKYKQCCLNR
mgnify:FL=1